MIISKDHGRCSLCGHQSEGVNVVMDGMPRLGRGDENTSRKNAGKALHICNHCIIKMAQTADLKLDIT
jgi:hypothetical protein